MTVTATIWVIAGTERSSMMKSSRLAAAAILAFASPLMTLAESESPKPNIVPVPAPEADATSLVQAIIRAHPKIEDGPIPVSESNVQAMIQAPVSGNELDTASSNEVALKTAAYDCYITSWGRLE
ncbi:hypothetical protein VTO42DRAFT_2186 [Malbranchea cinnamomea]